MNKSEDARPRTKVHGKKYSRQREVILNLLRGTRSHPDAQWIYERARRALPRLSLGTVYRNLRLMDENGSIIRLAWGGPQERYDGDVQPHDHVICDRCGIIVDLDDCLDKSLIDHAARASGMLITGHKLDFHGLCAACQKKTKANVK